MLLDLPRDVIWLILRKCLQDMYYDMLNNATNIFERQFLGKKFHNHDPRNKHFEKTFDKKIVDQSLMHTAYFVNFLYPLRLVCQKFNSIMRVKIIKIPQNSSSLYLKILY
jgi:hypothetical protein